MNEQPKSIDILTRCIVHFIFYENEEKILNIIDLFSIEARKEHFLADLILRELK